VNNKKYLRVIVLITTVGYIVTNLLFWLGAKFFENKISEKLQPDQYNVVIKQKYFLKNKSKYNLAFIGDSRTYCGMDPSIFDSIAQTKSINLAVFAFWLPSQYCYFKDFIPQMDTSVTLVWTIGAQNFLRVNTVNDTYPISIANYIELMKMGFKSSMISGNCIKHLPLTYFLSQREKFYNGLNTRCKILLKKYSLGKNEPTSSTKKNIPQERVISDYSFYKIIKSIPVYDNGKLTSYANLRAGGNYIRFETDSQYFRKKQMELGVRFKDNKKFIPDEEYYICFLAILDLMKKYHVKLIINEIEEAPFVYKNEKVRNKHRDFMKEVEHITLKYGFKYSRINFDTLQNWHYFDYNHLNSKGVLIYNTLLAKDLKSRLN